MEREFAAHLIRDEDNNITKIQTVKEHSENTARLAERFALPAFKDLCYDMGLLHDIGKYQKDFQKKIYEDDRLRVEHSSCGALAAAELFKNGFAILPAQYCIAGHHSGLPDGGSKKDTEDMSTLAGRLRRKTQSCAPCAEELSVRQDGFREYMQLLEQDGCRQNEELLVHKFAMFTRYCFSCLTDADSIDTAEFFDGPKLRSLHADFGNCLKKLDALLSSCKAETKLQKARAKLQKQAFERAEEDAEIYFMNMPTGSGKTLCSMKTALLRALKTGKKRIIYVIPYNSIIDQTVQVFTELFGEDAEILRHQSTFSAEDDESLDEDDRAMIRLATENWDAEIIITTVVQFFESIYGNKRKKLRKLHNMAESMLIFDEVHLMPMEYLQPCLEGIAFLVRYFESEALFLTATMPDFETLLKKYTSLELKTRELITDTSEFEAFKKCSYSFWEDVSEDALMERAGEQPSALIVVNKKAKAKELYEKCRGRAFHLSTYMTALDRSRVISEIRSALDDLAENYPSYENVPEEERVIVVSTSLIEAGVDLDFYAVYREMTGLDSILQAGGRCNREGKRENAEVTVFELSSEKVKTDRDGRKTAMEAIKKRYEDITSPECIVEYYKCLMNLPANREKGDSKSLSRMLPSISVQSILGIPFRTYTEQFRMIESENLSLVIPEDEISEGLVRELKETGQTNERSLQKYCASAAEWELKDLLEQGAVQQYGSGIWVLENIDYYDKETGLFFEASDYMF